MPLLGGFQGLRTLPALVRFTAAGRTFHGEAFARGGSFQNPAFEAAENPHGGPGAQSRAFH